MFHLELFFFRHSKSSVWGSWIVPVRPESAKRGLNHFQVDGGRDQSVASEPNHRRQRELYPSSRWHRRRDRLENRGQQFLPSRYLARQSLCEQYKYSTRLAQ